ARAASWRKSAYSASPKYVSRTRAWPPERRAFSISRPVNRRSAPPRSGTRSDIAFNNLASAAGGRRSDRERLDARGRERAARRDMGYARADSARNGSAPVPTGGAAVSSSHCFELVALHLLHVLALDADQFGRIDPLRGMEIAFIVDVGYAR